jgi:hypothetical protein
MFTSEEEDKEELESKRHGWGCVRGWIAQEGGQKEGRQND